VTIFVGGARPFCFRAAVGRGGTDNGGRDGGGEMETDVVYPLDDVMGELLPWELDAKGEDEPL